MYCIAFLNISCPDILNYKETNNKAQKLTPLNGKVLETWKADQSDGSHAHSLGH